MNLKRESACATQSGCVATWERRKVKLWEEPDQKLVTDDVRGGRHSFWAEWQLRRRAHPSRFQKPGVIHARNPSIKVAHCSTTLQQAALIFPLFS
jgi:hypothetical protein